MSDISKVYHCFVFVKLLYSNVWQLFLLVLCQIQFKKKLILVFLGWPGFFLDYFQSIFLAWERKPNNASHNPLKRKKKDKNMSFGLWRALQMRGKTKWKMWVLGTSYCIKSTFFETFSRSVRKFFKNNDFSLRRTVRLPQIAHFFWILEHCLLKRTWNTHKYMLTINSEENS